MLDNRCRRIGQRTFFRVLLFCLMGSNTAQAAGEVVGEMEVLKGQAAVDCVHGVPSGGWLAVKKRQSVHVGDTVRTDNGGEAVVRAGASVYMVRGGSELKLDESAEDKDSLRVKAVTLVKGLVTFFIPKQKGSEYRFKAQAGGVMAAVKGTVFELKREEACASVAVVKGAVDFVEVLAGPKSGPNKRSERSVKVDEGKSCEVCSLEPSRSKLDTGGGAADSFGASSKEEGARPPAPSSPMRGKADKSKAVSVSEIADSAEERIGAGPAIGFGAPRDIDNFGVKRSGVESDLGRAVGRALNDY